MKVSEIASSLNYDYVGVDYDVQGIAYKDEAGEHDIAVIKSKADITKVRSNVILTYPILIPISKTMLVTYDDIGYAIKKICGVLIHNGIYKDFSLPIKFEKTPDEYFIGQGCHIEQNSIIYPNVYIGNDVTIGHNCVISPNVIIESGTVLQNHVHIGSGSRIGADSFYHYYDEREMLHQFSGVGRTIIGSYVRIGNNCIVQRGTISNTIIGNNSMLGNCIDVGHDVKIGENCKIVSQSGIAGNAIIKNNVMVCGQAAISNDVIIGNNTVIKAKTLVSKSVDDNKVVFGLFGRDYNEELRIAAEIRKKYI